MPLSTVTFVTLLPVLVASLVLLLVLAIGRTLVTGVMTLRAIAVTPALSRRLSRWVKARDYNADEFFRADGAREPWIQIRRQGLERLAARLRLACPASLAWGNAIRESFSDLRFTDANRVPFPFAREMRDRFNLATVVTASDGPRLRDLDGRWSLDVSGSYGLNVAGFDRYKRWIEDGWKRVKDLGPVLGPLHPVVAENIAMLKAVSGLDDVSFHMSGTEAVMAAVRLARFNTRRKLIVCFSGAYHGWWDGVLPGLGNERTIDDCLTLKDLDPASLAVIRRRAREIAGVLVNPVQSFHPNSPPPNDALLLTSSVRTTQESTQAYGEWLRRLRAVCTACGIPLIFDEVYTGFRLGPGGGQEYFGVDADMVVYGKTVAGGLPIGVVCGARALMRRFDPERPMRLAYVVGTFSAHPAVMGAMNEFLRWVTEPGTRALYDEMNERCAAWVRSTNQQLADQSMPLRIVHFGTIWTVLFKEPGRYNWLLQYYLRAQGVTLSWVGTGRCLTSMDFTPAHYDALREAIVCAARQMQADGWLLTADHYPERETRMRMGLIKEMTGSLLQIPRPIKEFYAEVMRRKHDDHHASHNNKANQYLHLVSSSAFIYCYAALFSDLTTAMFLGVSSLFVRQIGHAVLEPPCHDEEATLLGYNTRNKTLIFIGYMAIPASHLLRASSWSVDALTAMAPAIAQQWFLWTVAVVAGRVVYLVWKHSFRMSMVWYAKLMSDPVTDIIAYFPRRAQRA
jgi:glutamate-1-semialdehyde 2,1-aminomutase